MLPGGGRLTLVFKPFLHDMRADKPPSYLKRMKSPLRGPLKSAHMR